MATDKAVTLNASRVLNTVGTPPKEMYHGIFLASVVNNNDPLGEGRVTLYIPQVLGTAVSNWAVPLGYTPTDIPAPTTMVHAYFAGGDVNHPIYVKISYATEFGNINTTTTSLQNQINGLGAGAWSALTLGTDWSNQSGYVPAQVRIVTPGVAQITGTMNYSGGGVLPGSQIATLPSGFRFTSQQMAPVTVTDVFTADQSIFPVNGITDSNGLTAPDITGSTGIVIDNNPTSADHQHFNGTLVVDNGQHVHTNLNLEQTVTVQTTNWNPFINIDTSGNVTIWNASENTTSISINALLVV
jgi:hypothetical protein